MNYRLFRSKMINENRKARGNWNHSDDTAHDTIHSLCRKIMEKTNLKDQMHMAGRPLSEIEDLMDDIEEHGKALHSLLSGYSSHIS